MKNILNKLSVKAIRHWHWLVLLPLAIVFFLATSFFNYRTQTSGFIKWSSPDETANYIFTKLYAEEGRMEIAERFNIEVKDIMHPRSFRVLDGVLKPMSFLGITLLYGKIAHFFGAQVIPYLTPFFAAVGLVFYYLLASLLFNRRVGLVAASLAAVFPVYFYFSAKSMFHNVLFVDLLIIGFFFAVKAAGKADSGKRFISKKIDWLNVLYLAFSGLAFGWAVATRSSELLWLGPVWCLLLALNWRRLAVWQGLIILMFGLLALLPVGYHNIQLYGGPLKTGYAEVNSSLITLSSSSQALAKEAITSNFSQFIALSDRLFETIFYFGFTPKVALKLFYTYSLALFPWLIVGFVLGFLFWLYDFRKIKAGQVYALAALAVTATILIVYYGSWEFYDNPDRNAITIGNSYTRYWLPVYLVMIMWLAYAIDWVAKALVQRRFSWFVRFALVIWLGIGAMGLVWSGSTESLKILIAKASDSRKQWELVMDKTERNAVIITKYQDKLFFPDRKVVYGLFDDDRMITEYAKLTKRLPTYFYSFSYRKEDLAYLNQRRLPRFGFRLEPVVSVQEFTLYRLKPVK